MRKRELPIPGQFLIPRGNRFYALQVVRYQKNGTVLCHRWDVDKKKQPIKQTGFGSDYFIITLNPLPLGTIGSITPGHWGNNAYDVFREIQLSKKNFQQEFSFSAGGEA